MRQFIRCAPGSWHFKAQAQVWRKALFNHTFIQLPSAEGSNQKNKQRGEKHKDLEGREPRQEKTI